MMHMAPSKFGQSAVRNSLFGGAMFALLVCAGCRTIAPKARSSNLPLKKMRLYESGVGYFERAGLVRPDARLDLLVPAAHVDDALKTMVVHSAGQASVESIEFDSVLSDGMARLQAGWDPRSDDVLDHFTLLQGLRGSRVQVSTLAGETVSGRLIEVSKASVGETSAGSEVSQNGGKGAVKRQPLTTWLVVLSDDSALRRFASRQVKNVRLLDAQLARRLRTAIRARSKLAAQNRRRLRVRASGDSALTLGYIAEVPIWRTSYRLVLEGQRASLQGWALIHNDTDEHWERIRAELVSGRPDSYLFPLAAPRYTRRPLAEPSETLASVPQLAEKTPDQMWGDHLGGEEGYGTLGGGAVGAVGHGSGYGRGSGRLVGVRSGKATESSELAIGNLAAIAPAAGTELGALFTYSLARPLALRAHSSALVPVLKAPVDHRRITWFASHDAQARSALRLRNTTRQTLPAGPIAIYEGGTFAGESALNRLKPGERQFLSFGRDLDIELERTRQKSRDELKRLRYTKGRLVRHLVRHHTREYSISNRSGSGRQIYLRLDVVDNSSVQGADELDYDAIEKTALVVFKLKARSSATRKLTIAEGLEQSITVENLDEKYVRRQLQSETLGAQQKKVLQAALPDVRGIRVARAGSKANRAKINEAKSDLKRLRGHLKAMHGQAHSSGAANPVVKRIIALEDNLKVWRAAIKKFEAQREGHVKALHQTLQDI